MIPQIFRMFAFVIGMLIISGCTTATVDAGSDKTVQVNQSVQITGTVTNSNGANVTYVWKEGSTVLANTKSFSYTPSTVGDHKLTFYVSDDKGNKDDDSMVVTATAVPNELPTANAGADATLEIGQVLTIVGSGTDTDGSIVAYEWKEGSTVLSNSASFDYVASAEGTHTLTLTVTDNDGATANDTMDITVTAVPNVAPTAEAGVDKSTQVNQAVTITGSGSDSDGSIAAYQWKEGATVLATTASFSYTPSTVGSHTLTLTVTDNNGATASDSMTVTATEAPNSAPTANAGTDKSVEVNQAVTISGSGTDTDGTIASYQWKEGATVLATTASFSYTPSTVGPHTLTLTVTDNNGATASDSMTVTATEAPNSAPTANAGTDKSVEVNQAVTITGSGTDSDGSIAVYQWKEGATVLATTATFSYTPSTVGSHTLTLTVTDNDGASDSDTMTVIATEVPNQAPTANAGADVSIQVNQSVTITGSGTDTDGTIVAYAWEKAGTGIIANTASFSYTPTEAGIHTLILTVTDNDGATATDSMTVTVEVAVGTDSDNDFIPNDVEILLGMDQFNPDEDNDGVLDGLQLDGSKGDSLFANQWHIRSTGELSSPYPASTTVVGNDLNLMDIYHTYMGYNHGNNIVIQVVDTGVTSTHEDLVDNMNLTLSRNSVTFAMGDPVEVDESSHGTMCAGIIAARAFNGKGVRGIAPFVKIAGSNWLSNSYISELEEAWTKNDPEGKIVLASNSWGTSGASTYEFYEDYMKYASENLRIVEGVVKGKLFIKSAGNGRTKKHDAGLSYASSNPYVITVAALRSNNTHTSYSSEGSSILVSGYSGNYFNDSATIGTTFIPERASLRENMTVDYEKNCYTRKSDGACTMPTWPEDTELSYTYGMNGTSAAAPTVAGSLALVLEACPTLPWRDVKYLIVKTAIQVDNTNDTWVTNAAGLHHSIDYGFGLINPSAMISLCTTNYTLLPESSTFTATVTPESSISIPDNDITGISYSFNIAQTKKIEWLAITLTSDHTNPANLAIYLTSPTGTKSRLMRGDNSGGTGYTMEPGFRFGSVAFMDEQSSGLWTVEIVDIVSGDTGKLQDVTFEVFGH